MFAQVLLRVTGNPVVRTVMTRSRFSRAVVSRFVPGEDVDAAEGAVRELAGAGLRATLDYLGEDITDVAQAVETVETYRLLVARLADAGLAEGNEISVKLSALGQSLGPDGPKEATERAYDLVQHATANGVDVTLDMEDHTTIDHTLETLRTLRAEFPRVGCVLQTMLFRTEADARALAHLGSRVRLVKGAYAEPASVSYAQKADTDRAYVDCLRILVEGGAYPMIATHDLRTVRHAERLLAEHGKGPADAEFQMLYGIRTSEQRRLAEAGHTVRVYIPFGSDWYGYFTRRLAERPANLLFFLRALISR